MIRTLLILLISRIGLRSPARLPSLMQRFSETEADSAWQMIQVMRQDCGPVLKAKLFGNTLEELHHAAIFGRLAAGLSSHALPLPTPVRDPMFKGLDRLAAFEAAHYVGEGDIYAHFSAYARAAGPGPIREAFLAIQMEEEGHQHLAQGELIKIAGSAAAARRLVFKERLKRTLATMGRAGRAVGDVLVGALLSAIYLVAGALFGSACRHRLAGRAPGDEAAAPPG